MKKKISKSLLMTTLITGLCIGGVQSAFAADNLNTFALDEYVVTATRTMKQLQEVPASVSVVTAKDIEDRNISTVPDVLQTLPGVYVSQSAQYGPTGNLTVRGYSSDNILVLVDGAPVNNAYNNDVDWEMLPVENIERIELVKGAGSSLYGGRAVGAVINIISKEASDKKVSGSAVLSYGSNSTWKKSVNANINVNDRFSFGVGYENKKSDGYKNYLYTASATSGSGVQTDKEIPQLSSGKYILGGRGDKEWENEHINANFKYKFDDSKSIRYTYTHNETEYRYANPWTNIYVNGQPQFSGSFDVGNGNIVKPSISSSILGYDGKKESDLHTLNYSDEANKFIVNFGYLDVTRNGYSSPSSPKTIPWNGAGSDSFYPGETYSLDVQKAWENIGKHNIVVGGNYRQESFDQIVTRLTNWRDHNSFDKTYGNYGVTAEHGGTAKNMALFIQDEYKFSEPFTMYLGVRYDKYKKQDGYGRGYNADGSSQGSKEYDTATFSEVSPKLAFDFKADETTNYYVSYGHSFNPPPLYQVYRNDVSGNNYRPNPDLEPETADTFEIGLKKRLSDKTALDLNAYYIETDDKILNVSYKDPSTSEKYTIYDNVGTEKRRGIELSLQHEFDKNWGAYFNYAWQKGESKVPVIPGSTNRIKSTTSDEYGIPKHLLHAGIDYKNDKLKALVECQYVSERQSPDDVTGEYGSEDAFFIVNTALNYEVAKNATLQFTINNLFDRDFYCSSMTPGRTYGVSLRYSF